ncbi:MAG TPA: primary-amine oxidase [Longimicrobiaceae bacterium]|nr:primary-amine oxidase [Longimicrobiaceae bacterium]
MAPWARLGAALLLLSAPPLAAQAAPAPHPLDPLTANELRTAVEVLRAAGRVTDESAIATLELREPAKDAPPGPREAFAVVYERAARTTHEAVVDLAARRVREWRAVPGVQPPFLASDYLLLLQVVRADSAWRAALRARGITDLNAVTFTPWMGGDYGHPEERGARIVRATFNYRGEARNEYARPVEGLAAFVDLDRRRVWRLVDTGPVPLAAAHDFPGPAAGPPRPPLAPLRVEQPEGPSFVVEGHAVRWDRWRFRWGVHPRDGLVLHAVRWDDGGRERTVLHRASVSEMVVPYADPGPAWYFRNAFDLGEFGLGAGSTSLLDAGVDAPENAVFLAAVYADELGEPVEVERAAALYERDGGLLWKHAQVLAGENEARRARQLVLSYPVTVGNYDYVFRWIFHQDGVLEHQVQLTGVLAVKGVAADADDPHGHRVQAGLQAVHHQHFFNYRLDLDVDGPRNRVVEMNARALPPGRDNPYGNAFTVEETVLGRELEARRRLEPSTGRAWKVVNPAAHTGYALVPGTNAVPYAHPTASVRRRAGFVDAHLWVTPYAPAEMNAAGAYVNQSAGGEGLPAWTRADRPLVDRDVVLWYTLGTTHLPRPEEWPVMPVQTLGFRLVPFGFFDRNPALDVPAARP